MDGQDYLCLVLSPSHACTMCIILYTTDSILTKKWNFRWNMSSFEDYENTGSIKHLFCLGYAAVIHIYPAVKKRIFLRDAGSKPRTLASASRLVHSTTEPPCTMHMSRVLFLIGAGPAGWAGLDVRGGIREDEESGRGLQHWWGRTEVTVTFHNSFL